MYFKKVYIYLLLWSIWGCSQQQRVIITPKFSKSEDKISFKYLGDHQCYKNKNKNQSFLRDQYLDSSKNYLYWNNLAICQVKFKEFFMAQNSFKTALELAKNHEQKAIVLNNRAIYFLIIGNWDLSNMDFQKSIHFNSSNQDIRKNFENFRKQASVAHNGYRENL